MYILKADIISKSLMEQKLWARLGPVSCLVLLIIEDVPVFRWETLNRKSSTKHVPATPDFVAMITASALTKPNALHSSPASSNGSRSRQRTTNLLAFRTKSLAHAPRFVLDARSILKLEKDAARASRLLARLEKKSLAARAKMDDYMDALKLEKTTALPSGSNDQR